MYIKILFIYGNPLLEHLIWVVFSFLCFINIIYIHIWHQIFSKYGQVEDAYLMHDEKKQNRGMFPTNI